MQHALERIHTAADDISDVIGIAERAVQRRALAHAWIRMT